LSRAAEARPEGIGRFLEDRQAAVHLLDVAALGHRVELGRRDVAHLCPEQDVARDGAATAAPPPPCSTTTDTA
jgi:hypothetical protein